MRLLACPICGKYPKIIDVFPNGVKVECRQRSYFGIRKNAHLIVYGWNLLDAVNDWNLAVEGYWKENK